MNSELYKNLIRCKNDTRREITIHAVVYLVLIVAGVLCFLGVHSTEGLESAIYFVLVFIIGIGVYAFFSIRKVRTTIALNRKREERLKALSEAQLAALDKEIENVQLQFKTFYLLENYFYVPKDKLLIRYDEIREFKNIIHSTNGIKDSIIIAITDTDGLLFEINVKHWKEYYKYCNSTAEAVKDKQRQNIN